LIPDRSLIDFIFISNRPTNRKSMMVDND